MIQNVAVRWVAVVGLAVLGGCAGSGTTGPRPQPAAKAPPPTSQSPAGSGPAEAPVGLPGTPPRPEAATGQAAPAPSGPALPSTAPAPLGSAPAPAPTSPGRGLATQAPPGRSITPPRPGRQIVLNFDNADIEAVIQAASEIAGFNYTIGPGVAGKKVTIQTSGRIPEDEVFNVLLAVLEVNGVTAIRSGNLYKIMPIGHDTAASKAGKVGQSGAAGEPS